MREVKRGNPTAAITLQVINLFNLSLPIQFLSIFHFHFAGDLFNLSLSIQFHVCCFSTTSCMWTTNATSGTICRFLLDFDKSRTTQVWQGRVVEFAPGEQTVDRSTLHSVCGKVSYVRVKALMPCLPQARSHSPTKFRPLTSAGGVAKWDLIFILQKSALLNVQRADLL